MTEAAEPFFTINKHAGRYDPVRGVVAVDANAYGQIAAALLSGRLVTYGTQFGLDFCNPAAKKNAQLGLSPETAEFAIIPYPLSAEAETVAKGRSLPRPACVPGF